MGADAREDSPRSRSCEACARQFAGSTESRQAETRQLPRVSQDSLGTQGTEKRLDNEFPVLDQWLHELFISSRIHTQALPGHIQGAIQYRRLAVIKRMGQRNIWLNPLQAI